MCSGVVSGAGPENEKQFTIERLVPGLENA
jgi:hypothetical protein